MAGETGQERTEVLRGGCGDLSEEKQAGKRVSFLKHCLFRHLELFVASLSLFRHFEDMHSCCVIYGVSYDLGMLEIGFISRFKAFWRVEFGFKM